MEDRPNIVPPGHRDRLEDFNVLLGILGALVGAVLSYYLFRWFTQRGIYAIAIPGVLIGLGARYSLQKDRWGVRIFCGVLAFIVGLYLEWKLFPFIKDKSLYYFITHLQSLKPVTWILIGIGSVFAYYFSAKPDIPPPVNPPSYKTEEQEGPTDPRNLY